MGFRSAKTSLQKNKGLSQTAAPKRIGTFIINTSGENKDGVVTFLSTS